MPRLLQPDAEGLEDTWRTTGLLYRKPQEARLECQRRNAVVAAVAAGQMNLKVRDEVSRQKCKPFSSTGGCHGKTLPTLGACLPTSNDLSPSKARPTACF